MKILTSILLAVAVMATGCVSPVPSTKISGTIAGQKFSLESPKDTTLSGLNISAATNGSVTMSIATLSSTNNSNTVASAYAGQAALVTAGGDAFAKGVQAGAAATGAFVGTAVKAP